jgi:adenylate kinase family enzyme
MPIEGKDVIFILGAPGSGKGTQAISAAKLFNFGYAAAGDLLREEAKKPDSPHGRRILEIMQAGQLVPPDLLVNTLQNAIRTSPHEKFLLDGFPRSIVQDDSFRQLVGLPTAVLLLDVPDEVLIRRISGRAAESQRIDDDAAVVEKRLLTHRLETVPVLERYDREGLLVRIEGNQPIETVREAFLAALRRFWNF